MKDGLGGQIMTKCVELTAKTYNHIKDGGSEDENQKAQICVSSKQKLKIIETFWWCSNDDKRKQSLDLAETYAYGISKDLVSESKVFQDNSIIKGYKNE